MDKRKLARASGVLGEVRAEQILIRRGMRVLERNYRACGAEIDLIALDGAVVAFIEVKTRAASSATRGREAVNFAKQKKICRGALAYMAKKRLMDRQARFDVIEIQGDQVTYIENAFPYCGPAF